MSTTMPPVRLPVVVNIAAPASFYDQIDSGGQALVWPDGTLLWLSLRALSSRVPVLDRNVAVPMAPPDNNGNNSRYDWSPEDMTTAGEGNFFAWWTFQVPGGDLQETPEFPIVISDHGPGLGTQIGAVVDGAQMYMPVTFGVLKSDVRFGDRRLQQMAELVKMKVLGYVIPVDQEDNLEIVLLDYLSKRTALDLITPGIDYWGRQLRTATSSQTSEVISYPDIISALQKLRATLCAELAEDWLQVQILVPGTPNRKVVPMPASSMEGLPFRTRNPQEMPRLRTGWTGWSFGDLGVYPFP